MIWMIDPNLKTKIDTLLRILSSYGLICQVDIYEFMTYVTAPTVTGDKTSINDIIENDF